MNYRTLFIGFVALLVARNAFADFLLAPDLKALQIKRKSGYISLSDFELKARSVCKEKISTFNDLNRDWKVHAQIDVFHQASSVILKYQTGLICYDVYFDFEGNFIKYKQNVYRG